MITAKETVTALDNWRKLGIDQDVFRYIHHNIVRFRREGDFEKHYNFVKHENPKREFSVGQEFGTNTRIRYVVDLKKRNPTLSPLELARQALEYQPIEGDNKTWKLPDLMPLLARKMKKPPPDPRIVSLARQINECETEIKDRQAKLTQLKDEMAALLK